MRKFGNLALDDGPSTQRPSGEAESGAEREPHQGSDGLREDMGSVGKKVTTWLRHSTPIEGAFIVGALVYAFFFWRSVGDWWFNPVWTTDDALQQVYPFHKALDPELFAGDVVTHMMEQYLTPLHYGINWGLTLLTKDPIMSGHWGMLIQLALTVGFVFFAVKSVGGLVPACFAAMWMLHTRHVVQRMTSGLPRGWAAPLFAAFFYFALKGNHRGMLATILVGCFLHPPATVVVAGAYGLHLLWSFADKRTREATRRPLGELVVLSPLFAIIAWLVVRMPPDIGTMASYEVAASMPEFSTPDGRFPFYPLQPISWELNIFAFQAFIARFYNPGSFVRAWMPEFVVGLCVCLAFVGWRKRTSVFPQAALCFLLSAFTVYLLSREFAFKLYVPNRHLQFPFAMFFVVGLTIAAWRVGESFARKGQRDPWQAVGMLGFLGAIIVVGSGSGLQGSANFNYSINKKGGVFQWIAQHTPKDALIAGEPTLIDGMMLFGKRAAFITTETAHPFYDKYYAAVKPRLEQTLRAHYAASLEEFVQVLEPTGVDYFVFDRKKFYPEELAKARYFKPFDTLIRDLTSGPVERYAFRHIPRVVKPQEFPALLYRDDFSVLVDVNALRAWLKSKATSTAGQVASAGERRVHL